MTKYLKVAIEFDDSVRNDTLVKDVYGCFAECGASFAGGHFKSEGFSLEKIIQTNEDYISGKSKDAHNCGFYQIKFRFGDFYEVRGCWDKNWREHENSLEFSLLISQDDFFEKTSSGEKERIDRMELVKALCLKLWQLPAVTCIQTAWDSSDLPPCLKTIGPECPPSMDTFAFISTNRYCENWRISGTPVKKNGILLECESNWLTKSKPTFEYGTDVIAYLEKAVEILKSDNHYHWADVSKLSPDYSYAIEEINGDLHYVRYTNFASGGNSKELLDVAPDAPNKKIKNGFGFIQRIVSDNLHHILGLNKKVSNYKVSFKQGTCSHGWYLEKYEFNRLESGDFSAFVQGGDRWSGGSREFFIPPEYLEGNYEEFLDKYAALVPGDNFGLYKKDLITDNGLKKFLGF